MGVDAFEEAVRVVDELADAGRRQELSSGEFTNGVVDAFLEYLRHEDPRDEPHLLVDYAVACAEELGGLRLFADRLLAAEVERLLGWCLARQGRRLELDALLRDLSERLTEGDDVARTELFELCRDGEDLRPALFAPVGWGIEVLRLAHRFGQARALHAALDPRFPGRLASPRRDEGDAYAVALDALAHLAVDPCRPDTATVARRCLVDLVRHHRTAPDAAVRVPPHRLDAEDREVLLVALEARDELEARWAAEGYECDGLRRGTLIVRTLVWQAADCVHADLVTSS
ncbi:MAG: hypothetical protein ACOYOP_03070 [Microthrixaceae bacterium]